MFLKLDVRMCVILPLQGFRKEMKVIDEGLDKIKLELPDLAGGAPMPLDEVLVGMQFAIKNSGRLNLRFLGCRKKLSEDFAREHKVLLQGIERKVEDLANVVLSLKSQVVFLCTNDTVVMFCKKCLQGESFVGGLACAERAVEVLQSRRVLSSRALPSLCGMQHLLGEESLAHADAKFKTIEQFILALEAVVKAVEFKDATTVVVDVFAKEWKHLFTTMDGGLDLFGGGRGSIFQGTEEAKLADTFDSFATAFRPLVRVFLDSLMAEHPWLKGALAKKTGKIAWPAAIPESLVSAEFKEKLTFACDFYKTAAAEGNPHTLSEELRLVPKVAAVGLARRELLDTYKSKAADAKTVRRKTASCLTLMTKIEDAEASCNVHIAPVFTLCMGAEQEYVAQKFEELYTIVGDQLASSAKPGSAIVAQISLDKFWSPPGPGGQTGEMLEVLNSPKAAELRTLWGPLVNVRSLLDHIHEALCIDRFAYIQEKQLALHESLGHTSIFQDYDKCRDKVCELSLAKAWARPLKKTKVAKMFSWQH